MRSGPLILLVLLSAPTCSVSGPGSTPSRPNIVVVMTDDQGLGDFGFAGNPVLRTPNLDRMATRSARLTNFYVSPVCTPTRAACMTGRHPQRTRAIDTWIGRAMMDPDETTVAELLRDAGFATGIFGKWHLGDCYPMRAMDQGFTESLVHRGGGIGQPSDPLGGEGKYTDPILIHNGEETETEGYCTDLYFDAAIEWMEEQHRAGRPFFTYLATNAPHGPFHDVPAELLERYRHQNLSPARFPQDRGHPLPAKANRNLPNIYAMIENIDANVGKLHHALRRMGADRNTLVLFLVDNGPNTRRFVRGHRGMKTEVYEGGIRSPLLAYWPGRLNPGVASDRIAAHFDLLPTVLEACGVPVPDGLELDGRSLWPLLTGQPVDWPDRALVLQAHRGDVPVRYHHCAVRTQQYKLLSSSGFGRELTEVLPRFELYDLEEDPFELSDIAPRRPDLVERLRRRYDDWFDDVTATRADLGTPSPILIGAAAAPRVVLTRQDWQRIGSKGGWGPRSLGEWRVRVEGPGPYTIRVYGRQRAKASVVTLTLGDKVLAGVLDGRSCAWEGVKFPTGIAHLRATLTDDQGTAGAYQVHIETE